jgi:Holliday junction resolvase RusA-like endonuclease
MAFLKPKRGELIAVLPIFNKISPLARPRINRHTSSIYQPKENQKALLSDIKVFEPLEIAFNVIVDTYINFELPEEGKKRGDISDKRYGDEDNLRKAIADALQFGKIIIDDRYVIGGENFKWLGPEDFCLIKIYGISGEEHIEF